MGSLKGDPNIPSEGSLCNGGRRIEMANGTRARTTRTARTKKTHFNCGDSSRRARENGSPEEHSSDTDLRSRQRR